MKHTLVALIAVLTLGAMSPTDPDAPAGCDRARDLKARYLSCERSALRHGLSTGDIMRCSVIYETLKHEVFGGDFQSLRAWSDVALRVGVPVSMTDGCSG